MPQFPEITERFRHFIEQQKIFFVGTAARDGRVNIAPKGMDTLRVLGPHRIAWLNLTGGENESAAHLRETTRMTLMWCAFDGAPSFYVLTAMPRSSTRAIGAGTRWRRCSPSTQVPGKSSI